MSEYITLDKLLELGWSEDNLRTLELIDIESTRGLNIWVRCVYQTWDEVFRDRGNFSNYRILKSKLPVCAWCKGIGKCLIICSECHGTGIGQPEKSNERK